MVEQKTSRPVSLFELRKQILEYSWDRSKQSKHSLKSAQDFLKEGKDYTIINPERAFVALAHAANLILVKLPTHNDYAVILTETQRENLRAVGFYCPFFLLPFLIQYLAGRVIGFRRTPQSQGNRHPALQ